MASCLKEYFNEIAPYEKIKVDARIEFICSKTPDFQILH